MCNHKVNGTHVDQVTDMHERVFIDNLFNSKSRSN